MNIEPERRTSEKEAASRWQEISERLQDGDKRMGAIESTVAKLVIDAETLIDLLRAFEGAVKVLEGLGKLAKPIGTIAAMATALYGLWVAIKTGMSR